MSIFNASFKSRQYHVKVHMNTEVENYEFKLSAVISAIRI
jgi:hypothetical protein